MLLRFAAAYFLFTFGPGAACGLWFTRGIDTPRRVVILLGIGTAATAVLIDVLGRVGLLAAFPYVAIASALISLALWRRGAATPDAQAWNQRDVAACAVIVLLAIGAGYVAFAHRIAEDPDQLALKGDYDSLDLSYYAAISAEATHTVPPKASYYSGHELNYAYYPQLVLAMVHRFAGVPLLEMFFGYAWPAFLVVGALTAYLFIRAMTGTGTALLAVVLIMTAGDFSYLAAWYLPHANFNWDYVLWPTNFLSPTMETLYFNSWTPSLPIFFTALWCTATGFTHTNRSATRPRPGWMWIVMSALLLGVLFQFKPFAFLVLSAGMVGAVVFSIGDWDARRRLAALLALSGVFALPFVYRSMRLYADRRSELRLDFFPLPQRMLIKLDLVDVFANWAGRIAPVSGLAKPLFIMAATALFFAGGIGMRWLGAPPLVRALVGRVGENATAWHLLAWATLAGIAIPFVIVTEPYNDTLQFYQTGLYLLWIFAAVTLVQLGARHRWRGVAAIAAVMALSAPSSLHYLSRRWADSTRAPLVGLTRTEVSIAVYLRSLDPDTTVVLNDRPLEPSLMTVLSERRVVLAWARYAVGSGERLREVDAFYASTRQPAALLDILRKHHVTHVVVHQDRDRVHPDVLAMLKPIMGDAVVMLYQVPSAGSR